MLIPQPKTIYKKNTSDINLKILLEKIAEVLGTTIEVHSGDRDYRPKGSPAKSLHLVHRAADFHAVGLTDEEAFEILLSSGDKLISSLWRFQILRHGPYTHTEGPHIHVGEYHLIQEVFHGPGISYYTEGLSPYKGPLHCQLVKFLPAKA